MNEIGDCGHNPFSAGLTQDLIAVRVIVDHARLALPSEMRGLREALAAAAGTLDANLEVVRAMDGSIPPGSLTPVMTTHGRSNA